MSTLYATIGYFAQKAAEARQRTEEWGTAVSKAEAQELSRFKDKVDETTKAMETFGTEGVEDVEAVKTAFSSLIDEINKLVDENYEDWYQGRRDEILREKLKDREAALQRLIRSSIPAATYAKTLATWAATAGSFPTFDTIHPLSHQPIYRIVTGKQIGRAHV